MPGISRLCTNGDVQNLWILERLMRFPQNSDKIAPRVVETLRPQFSDVPQALIMKRMTHNAQVKLWSAAALAVTFAATAFILRLEGRVWFCECWQPRLWIGDANSEHTSQHLLDPYSLTHLEHGLLLFVALILVLPDRAPSNDTDGVARSTRRRVLRFWIATLVECGWEVLENSAWIINRYREGTAALGYTGDSVWNSLGDVLSCVAGYLIAQQLGWRRTLALFVVFELVLLFWIRDNLTLNVVMLAWPIEAIKTWQTAG